MNARGEICTFPQFSCGKVLIIVEKSDNKEQDVNSFGAALGKTGDAFDGCFCVAVALAFVLH